MSGTRGGIDRNAKVRAEHGSVDLQSSASSAARLSAIARVAKLLPLVALTGCAALASSATSGLADSVSRAILNQTDVATVRDGAPAYLLLIDGLIDTEPDNQDLLLAGASLYGAYASAFVDDETRALRLADRSRGYGRRALCVRRSDLCARIDLPFREFEPGLAELRRSDVPALYGFAVSWAGWVQANSDDWAAVAEVPKIEASLQRVVELEPGYENGSAYLYLGVLATLLPSALGGEPEVGRRHFERAIELSRDRNLMAKVLFAQKYAMLVFDRELHDALLNQVLAADPVARDLTLSNTIAQEQARELLQDADDYF